jgi:hypothetical protein
MTSYLCSRRKNSLKVKSDFTGMDTELPHKHFLWQGTERFSYNLKMVPFQFSTPAVIGQAGDRVTTVDFKTMRFSHA